MKELGKIKRIVEEATGLQITHMYEDLVFVEMGAFLIRFDNADFNHFSVVFNRDCEALARVNLYESLAKSAKSARMRCDQDGEFSMSEGSQEGEVKLEFFPG